MIVAGHQPQYIPYIGFFNKISKADIFVFVDNIQFNRKSWQQRTLIKSNNSAILLTIPVIKKGKYYQNINEVEIIDDGWRKKHWKTIMLSYSKTPYFDYYKNDLESFYIRQWKCLSDFTINLTKYLIDAIGIKFKNIEIGSKLGITGEKTDLLIDICNKTGSDTYLSGIGAKSYLDEDKFKQKNLNHIFNNFQTKAYSQYGEAFLDGMGIIDVMFMNGPQTLEIIRGNI